MKLCNSIEDIIKMWPYGKSRPPVKNFPRNYPVLAEFIERDGGIGGDYYNLEIIKIPKNYTDREIAAFIAGVKSEPKTIASF